jgi:hypothetical protein
MNKVNHDIKEWGKLSQDIKETAISTCGRSLISTIHIACVDY